MQISRRFEADTLLDMCRKKDNSFVGDTRPLVYNLDEYTRFSNLEETLREYVNFARVRGLNSKAELKVVWGLREGVLHWLTVFRSVTIPRFWNWTNSW